MISQRPLPNNTDAFFFLFFMPGEIGFRQFKKIQIKVSTLNPHFSLRLENRRDLRTPPTRVKQCGARARYIYLDSCYGHQTAIGGKNNRIKKASDGDRKQFSEEIKRRARLV